MQFSQFARLPSDLQLIILEYICDRRDPFRINDQDKLKLWTKVRLVCREWSLWFSFGAIRYIRIAIKKITSHQLLERMTNLKSLEMCSPHDETLEPEALKRMAAMIPNSVKHLGNCSVNLLHFLPRNIAGALQTIDLSCDASEPQIVQALKSAFRKFGGRIKILKLSFNNFRNNSREATEWKNVLSDSALEELSLGKFRYQQHLPLLPTTLKRLKVCPTGQIDLETLFPAAESLEMIDAYDSTLTVGLNTPVFPNLIEIQVKKIVCSPENEHLLSICWPNLENIKLNFPDEQITQQMFKLPSLRSINILYQKNDGAYFSLSDLPPQLEEFVFYSLYGTIRGQFQQEMRHLRKLVVNVDAVNLTKGVFNFFPALEELSLSCHNHEVYKGIDLGELLPLRHTLINLTIQVCSNNDTDALYQFTRLKRLCLSCWGNKEPFKISSIPQSLVKLELHGNFIQGLLPMGLLPNLKELFLRHCSAQLIISFLDNSPNLRLFFITKDGQEIDAVMNGLKGMKHQRLARVAFDVNLEPLTECVFQLLQNFPNMEYFHVCRNHSKDAITEFPVQLLSFLQNNQSVGLHLEDVRIGSDSIFKDFDEDSKAALQELQKKGIQLEIRTSK